MFAYKTLVVAPKTDLLLVEDEVQQVVNYLGAKMLRGSQADMQGLLDIVSESFDILWFSTHGDESGVYLNDGIVSISELTTLIRGSGARLVVFNTCQSRSVALTIYDELKIPFVCTIAKVPDRMAFITGTLFARYIALGLSFREAYEKAKPGQNRTYTFLPDEGRPVDKRVRVENDLDSIVNSVRRLEIIVTGSTDYNVEGLVPTVKKLSIQIDDLLSDFMIMRANQILNRRLLLSLSFICITLLIAVVILVFRQV